jgi:hypothetical protein
MVHYGEFETRIRSYLKDLLNRGTVHLISSDVSPENMGNAEVVIGLENAMIRFVRDRSHESMDIAPIEGPTDWFDFSLVAHTLTGDIITKQPTIEELTQVLEAKLDAINNMFSVNHLDATISQLKEKERLRFQKMFGGESEIC